MFLVNNCPYKGNYQNGTYLISSKLLQINGDIATEDVSFLSSDNIKDAVVDFSKGFKR